MGRQIAAKLSDSKERALLAFLQESADVTLICASAPTVAELFAQDFRPRGDWSWFYYLWNRAYPWVPEVVQFKDHFGIRNAIGAPLVEYSRQNLDGVEPAGRIYWAKDFSSAEGLTYDTVAFNHWYESIAKWVRRHGRAP